MNIYRMIGHALGTPEALELADRLSGWHDAMVAHERRRGPRDCGEQCPHVEAHPLWTEAARIFGDRARELAFLESRALKEVAP